MDVGAEIDVETGQRVIGKSGAVVLRQDRRAARQQREHRQHRMLSSGSGDRSLQSLCDAGVVDVDADGELQRTIAIGEQVRPQERAIVANAYSVDAGIAAARDIGREEQQVGLRCRCS